MIFYLLLIFGVFPFLVILTLGYILFGDLPPKIYQDTTKTDEYFRRLENCKTDEDHNSLIRELSQ